jgi:CubicO group peptidase (beta-lactamase class C family)
MSTMSQRHIPALLVLLLGTTRLASAQGYAAVDAAIESGIHDHVYPGAVVIVGRADTVLYAHGYGHFTWSTSSQVPDPSMTRWDLASLTKIVATTASMARLVQDHRVDLDAPVARYLPQFTGGRKPEVTVRMLLNHTSGMPPYAKFFQTAHSPDEARAQLFATPLKRPPATGAEYSDLNAMLAGFVVARVVGEPLDRVADSLVFTPLRMLSTHFRPTGIDKANAAPTGQYRGHPVGGIVNDQNGVVFGGVSGHAGVFSTGADLSRFMQAWLHAANDKGNWVHRATVAEFLTRSPTSDTRVLGWDTPVPPNSKKPSLYGRCATTSTFGHTGWTGTELWFDPAQDLFVVLLTNRSFAPADPKGSFLQLKAVRAKVADAVRSALGGCKGM